jgi:hypothetical protein
MNDKPTRDNRQHRKGFPVDNLHTDQAPLEDSHFSAPLAGFDSGRLVLASDVAWMVLRAGAGNSDLYQAHFRRHTPRLRMQENTLSLDYGQAPVRQDPQDPAPLAEIYLNGSIPWEIEFHQGVTHLNAALSRLALRSLDILGRASRIRLALPKPLDKTYIHISGEISQSTIWLPQGPELVVNVSGAASDILLDNRRYYVLKGEERLVSPGDSGEHGECLICLAGGAKELHIERQD